MRRLLAIVLPLALFAAAPLAAEPKRDEPKTTRADETNRDPETQDESASADRERAAADTPHSGESPLVRAAREGRKKRTGEKSRFVINDETVKHSTGRITIIQSEMPEIATEAEPADAVFARMAAEKKLKEERARIAREQIDRLQTEIAALERELERTQDEYFDEGDLNYREEVLHQRWKEARDRLSARREELAKIRAEYDRLVRETSNIYKP